MMLIALLATATLANDTTEEPEVPAGDGMPLASATLAPDGHYTLTLVPGTAWRAAEVSLSGAGNTDLGPTVAADPVLVEGWIDHPGPFDVSVCAARSDRQGTCWMFQVDPEPVPVVAPELERGERQRLKILNLLHR